jgi:nitrile hydratase accessory protein
MMSLTGDAAPPMANGEVVFEAPWQGRVFGMARSLCESGLYDWDEFRGRLIAEIATFESDADEYHYFDHFLSALTRLLDEKGLCLGIEVNHRSEVFAARPHGHDH